MDSAELSARYVKLCQGLIRDVGARKVDLFDACPASDVAEDFMDQKDNELSWKLLVETVESFAANEWEPTIWILSVMYGEMWAERLLQSFSLVIKRRNGSTEIESGNEALRQSTQELLQSVNPDQTDEWYLRNLAALLPENIGGLVFMSCDVEEYLTEHYYPR